MSKKVPEFILPSKLQEIEQFYDDKILREDIHQIYHGVKLNSNDFKKMFNRNIRAIEDQLVIFIFYFFQDETSKIERNEETLPIDFEKRLFDLEAEEKVFNMYNKKSNNY